jgi:hypothetical protein
MTVRKGLTLEQLVRPDAKNCEEPEYIQGPLFGAATGMEYGWMRISAAIPSPVWSRRIISRLAGWPMAAVHRGLVPRPLSFMGALQAVNAFGTALLFAAATAQEALLEALYDTLGAHRVGQRPGRVEPRAVKRRPKPPPLMTIPRHQARKNVGRGQQYA